MLKSLQAYFFCPVLQAIRPLKATFEAEYLHKFKSKKKEKIGYE
jgi:hypothetical protein